MSNANDPPAQDSSSRAKESEKDRIDRLESNMAELGNMLRNFIGQQSQGEAPSSVVQETELREERSARLPLLERFHRFNPPTFKGSADATEAENWIMEIEMLLDAMDCDDLQRAHLAVFKMTGEAQNWWKGTKGALLRDGPITWARFVSAFYSKYFSRVEQAKREREFIDLVQGNDTVNEYQAKFSALSRFAPHMVADEERKVARFQGGLRYEIEEKMIPFKLTSYDEAVAMAQNIEQGEKEHRRKMGNYQGKGKAGASQS